MHEFETINYSLRPNKAIQRHLVFDGLQLLSKAIPISTAKYVGFGSIWFADFILAHKRLGIQDMLSMERDPVLFSRAKFNAPFRTIKVVEGDSNTVLPRLARNRAAKRLPWIIWLDYVGPPSAAVVEDLDTIVDHAPMNSVLIVTLNAVGRSIGSGLEGRRAALRGIIGDIVPEDAPVRTFEEGNIPLLVANYISEYIDARCKTFARKPGYVPAFRVPYRDNAQMVTFGGILPGAETVDAVRDVVESSEWPCMPNISVETPPLTPKELSALQRALPSKGKLTRDDLRRMGFDLEDGMLEVYCAHYRRYPSFFQVVA